MLTLGWASTAAHFGKILFYKGRDVSILVSPAIAPHCDEAMTMYMRRNAFPVRQPQLVTDPATLDASFDVILIGGSTDHRIHDLLTVCESAISETTLILPLSVGVRHVDSLVARFGDRILGCCASPSCDVVPSYNRQSLLFGELSGEMTPRAEELKMFLSPERSFPVKLSSEIRTDLWREWVREVAINAIALLLSPNVLEAISTPEGRGIVEGVIAECISIAAASGHSTGDEAIRQALPILTEANADSRASIYTSLLSNQPDRADQLLGDLLMRAAQSCVEIPLLHKADEQLSIRRAHRHALMNA